MMVFDLENGERRDLLRDFETSSRMSEFSILFSRSFSEQEILENLISRMNIFSRHRDRVIIHRAALYPGVLASPHKSVRSK